MLAYPRALLRQSLVAAATDRGMFAMLAGTMFLNDLLFFLLWVVFFSGVRDVRGWTLADVAAFQGMVVIGFGLAAFFARGAWHIGRRVVSGELDVFLARPRHALPQLMTVECDGAALGDVVYGLVLLATFTHLDFAALCLALAISTLVAVLFLALGIFLQSLAFFLRGGSALGDQLFEMMLCLGTIPQHTNGMVVKMLMFTVLPAGFMAIMPVEIVRRHSLMLLAGMAGAVGIYMWIAVAMFGRGLRRYTSATGWSA